MAIDVKAEILIQRARNDVSRFAMDPQNDPIWIGEPPAHIVMRTDSPFDMTIRYDFEEDDGATRMRINLRGEGSGFFNVAGPLLGLQVKRNLRRDLGKLKTLMESGAA